MIDDRARTSYSPELPNPPATIHFIGIGGIGMSGLARILHARGYRITGSDIQESPVADELRLLGIPVTVGHDARNVGDAEFVVATAAARETNPELQEAKRREIPTVKRAALLGSISRHSVTLAVGGSHGKSTTSGMAAFALDYAGCDPTFAVGAKVQQFGVNARPGQGTIFVAEADEYDYSFLKLEPTVAIVTNIEHDHPDLFPSFDDVLAAFEQFAGKVRPKGALVLCADDAGCQELVSRLPSDFSPQIVTYGRSTGDWRVDESGQASGPGERTFELHLSVPGGHNQLNALAVIASAEKLGVAPEKILAGLESFTGVGRRFEVLPGAENVVVIDDYAHHPTEIRATIEAARSRYPGRRLHAVFQPHTYSRTRLLLEEFAEALSTADLVTLVDIYPARELDDLGVSSASIGEKVTVPAQVAGGIHQTYETVRAGARDGDVILVLGAGDIYQVAQKLAEAL